MHQQIGSEGRRDDALWLMHGRAVSRKAPWKPTACPKLSWSEHSSLTEEKVEARPTKIMVVAGHCGPGCAFVRNSDSAFGRRIFLWHQAEFSVCHTNKWR